MHHSNSIGVDRRVCPSNLQISYFLVERTGDRSYLHIIKMKLVSPFVIQL